MTMRTLLLATPFLLLATAAHAQSPPPSARPVAAATDAARVSARAAGWQGATQLFVYAPGGLYQVYAAVGQVTDIMLQEGETLSGFIEASVRETIQRRRVRSEFIARGLASREEAKRTGVYIDVDVVHAELAKKLARARTQLQKKARA